ncbi:MAG TPA: hypothetical protein VH500_17725 [Nitrososphaeraceae archaeon]
MYKNTITKLCDKFRATRVHRNKGSVLTFDLVYLDQNPQIIKCGDQDETALRSYMKNEGNITSELYKNYDEFHK